MYSICQYQFYVSAVLPCFPLNFPYPGVLLHALCNSSTSLPQIRMRMRAGLSLLLAPLSRSCAKSKLFSLGPEQSFCTCTSQCQSAELSIVDCSATTFSSLHSALPSPPPAKTQMGVSSVSQSSSTQQQHIAALALERITNTRHIGENSLSQPSMKGRVVGIHHCSECLFIGFKETNSYLCYFLPSFRRLSSPAIALVLSCLSLLRQPHGSKIMPAH